MNTLKTKLRDLIQLRTKGKWVYTNEDREITAEHPGHEDGYDYVVHSLSTPENCELICRLVNGSEEIADLMDVWHRTPLTKQALWNAIAALDKKLNPAPSEDEA